MSTKRRGTWGPKGKGPNGRNLCYCGCGREVPKGCRTKYEQACWNRWAERYDPATQRVLVHARDKGVCALCGVDTELRQRVARETERLIRWLARRHAEDLFRAGILLDPQTGQPARAWGTCWFWETRWTRRQMRARFGEVDGAGGHTWEADHILPVIEGGGECDLSNLRTLCLPCHRKETAKLARRRAEARRAAKSIDIAPVCARSRKGTGHGAGISLPASA